MLDRTSCPITANAGVVPRVDLPYDSGLPGEWAAQRHLRERLAGLRFTIFQNPAIDFFFQRFVFDLTEETVRREGIALKHVEPRQQGLNELCHKAEDAILVRLLHPGRRPKVLDYAMGNGVWARMARAYDCEVWGTDLDPRSAAIAADSGVRFEGEIAGLPDAFDFINADQVFEHLPDPVGTLRQLAAKLRRGGHVKISTPAEPRIERKLARLASGAYSLEEFKRELHALSPLCHINLFTATSLRALATAAGLESYRLPLRACYAVMTGFHSARQINRNLCTPLKRFRARGTWQFFVKP